MRTERKGGHRASMFLNGLPRTRWAGRLPRCRPGLSSMASSVLMGRAGCPGCWTRLVLLTVLFGPAWGIGPGQRPGRQQSNQACSAANRSSTADILSVVGVYYKSMYVCMASATAGGQGRVAWPVWPPSSMGVTNARREGDCVKTFEVALH
jgi:hypothetical protein